MKKNFFHVLLVCIYVASSLISSAQVGDHFNSRSGVALNQVKSYLETNYCTFFVGLDVNANGWNPNIEGNGAMVSENLPSAGTGIYSPVLDIATNIIVEFNYKFNNPIGPGESRRLSVYLTDGNQAIKELLDEVEFTEFTGINTTNTYTYNKSLATTPGGSRVFISYSGIGGSAAIAIDPLVIYLAPPFYTSICNGAPTAGDDIISGNIDRTSAGSVIANDSDPNSEPLQAHLITASPDGTVVVNTNGSFTFTPNAGFNGSSTNFTYNVCDMGQGPLCSNPATVTINFPSGSLLPLSLVDFSGLYKNDGDIQLNWVTTFEQHTDKFEVERSFDGVVWQKAGSLKAQGESSVKKSYSFTDNLSRNTVNKKDVYYRLKQIDINNKAGYSRILVVRVYNSRSTKMISVTPNPSKNDIAVNVQLNESSVIVMKVFAANGAEVMRKSAKAGAGSNSFLIDGTSKLKPGMYVLEVIINSKDRMNIKLIKE